MNGHHRVRRSLFIAECNDHIIFFEGLSNGVEAVPGMQNDG